MVRAPSKTACEGGRMSQGQPAWGPRPETGAWRQQGWGWNGVGPGGAAPAGSTPFRAPLHVLVCPQRGRRREGRESHTGWVYAHTHG